jgi:transitional endoplasmic reticulum ATPase
VDQRASALALLLSGPTCNRGDWIDVSNTDIQCIAEQTVGFVIADLVALQREATLRAVRLALEARSGQSDQQVMQSVRLQLSHFQHVIASRIIVASSIRGHTKPVELPSSTDSTPQPTSTAGASSAWSDIGGLAAVKQRLQQAVEWPLRFAAQFERLALKPPRGVLMYGPPGCAKTTLVRAIAKSGIASCVSSFLH